ncbi:MAG: hypothetical protein QNI99_02850 [Woeseiaceae bacterium]|nr:hypothetical protein [Woeseiaceae bacterium]
MRTSTQKLARFAVAAFALSATGWSASVWAKSCWDLVIPVQDDPAEFVDSLSDVIFEGTATDKRVETYSSTDGAEYVSAEDTIFSVDAVIKGSLDVDERVLVVGRRGDCRCIRGFELGKRYRVIANLSTIDGVDRIEIKYCDYIVEIDE